MTDDMLIHIGFHKTGSSFLQHQVFADDQLGFGLVRRKDPEVAEAIRHEHPYRFRPDVARHKLRAQCAEQREKGRYPVLSHEGLSGQIFCGGFDSLGIMRRLNEVEPNARILIVIREQTGMLISLYNQYVRSGGREHFQDFLRHPGGGQLHFHRDHLSYHNLIGAYQQAFGPDRVLALPYEMLKRDQVDFVTRIMKFCQLDLDDDGQKRVAGLGTVNPSIPPVGNAIKRWTNFLARLPERAGIHGPVPFTITRKTNNRIKRYTRRIGELAPASWNSRLQERFRSTVLSEIGDHYRDSNRRTSELIGIDLAALGYDC
ncbi:sulfotransferase [Aurantiacibacter sp. MUD11]|uniref:sulfotransferase n=1 Tax=Aurantiacibacter sp. MUD11 TaxID=3003265 RepID=UPI0022AACD08|nr:sulfotransferase [Aurantiacibacter sp. MUD11]WAT18947.1 sulfotransferase [Aurantiacibacter sp. MUD11]